MSKCNMIDVGLQLLLLSLLLSSATTALCV